MASKSKLGDDIESRLTIIGRGSRPKYVLCLCACGTKKEILKQSVDEKHTRSCGCLQRELMTKRCRTHGRSRDLIYALWRTMIARCHNPNDGAFVDYGGRGIQVCSRWRGDGGFENFLEDMGERPDGMQLDRYPDQNGNYEPGNVRWATPKQNSRNRRSNRILSLNGKSQTLAAWAEELKIGPSTILNRLKSGWSIERALTSRKIVGRPR